MRTYSNFNKWYEFAAVWLLLLALVQPLFGQGIIHESGVKVLENEIQQNDGLAKMLANAPVVVTFETGVYGDYGNMLNVAGIQFDNCETVVHSSDKKLYPLAEQLSKGGSVAFEIENELTENEAQRLRTVKVAGANDIEAIKAMPNVANAYVDELCTIYEPIAELTDEPFIKLGLQYQLEANKFIQLFEYLESIGYEPQGTKVGVIDTGIWSGHPDMDGSVAQVFVLSEDGVAGQDLNGHGTHVGGTIGMRLNGSGGLGCAYHATLVDACTLNKSGGQFGNVVNDAVFKLIAAGVDIINMSLGPFSEPYSTPAIEAAEAANIPIVIATGNSGRPVNENAAANNPTVLAVGAHDKNFNRASFSNYNDNCVYASGRKVTAPHHNNPALFVTKSGTSMATPVASSAVYYVVDFSKWWAAIHGIEINLTSQQIEDFVRHSCDTIGNVRAVNALAAVKLTESYLVQTYLGGTPPPESDVPFLVVNGSDLSIDKSVDGTTQLVYNNGEIQQSFNCSDFGEAYQILQAANNSNLGLAIDTVNHVIEIQQISGLTDAQNALLNKLIRLDAQGLKGSPADARAFQSQFGYCVELQAVIDILKSALNNNLDNWSAKRIRRMKFAIWGFRIGYSLIGCNDVPSAQIGAAYHQKANDLANQILAY